MLVAPRAPRTVRWAESIGRNNLFFISYTWLIPSAHSVDLPLLGIYFGGVARLDLAWKMLRSILAATDESSK